MKDYQSPSYTCKICSNPTILYEHYDSYVCALCNTWNEDACSDNFCYYCSNRPDKPFNDYEHSIFMQAYEEYGINALLWLVDDYLEGN